MDQLQELEERINAYHELEQLRRLSPEEMMEFFDLNELRLDWLRQAGQKRARDVGMCT